MAGAGRGQGGPQRPGCRTAGERWGAARSGALPPRRRRSGERREPPCPPATAASRSLLTHTADSATPCWGLRRARHAPRGEQYTLPPPCPAGPRPRRAPAAPGPPPAPPPGLGTRPPVPRPRERLRPRERPRPRRCRAPGLVSQRPALCRGEVVAARSPPGLLPSAPRACFPRGCPHLRLTPLQGLLPSHNGCSPQLLTQRPHFSAPHCFLGALLEREATLLFPSSVSPWLVRASQKVPFAQELVTVGASSSTQGSFSHPGTFAHPYVACSFFSCFCFHVCCFITSWQEFCHLPGRPVKEQEWPFKALPFICVRRMPESVKQKLRDITARVGTKRSFRVKNDPLSVSVSLWGTVV